MHKDNFPTPSERAVLYGRLAYLLEEASTLAFEVSQSESDTPLTDLADIRLLKSIPGQVLTLLMERLSTVDPGLADTLALMVNDEARSAIERSLKEARTGKVRPAREFFNAV